MKKTEAAALLTKLTTLEFDNISNLNKLEFSEDMIEVLQTLIDLTEKDSLTEKEEEILQEGLKIVTQIVIPLISEGKVDIAMHKLKK